jgi:hypothetical protein
MLYTLAPVMYDLDLPEPEGRPVNDVAIYVATHLLDGRALFDVLDDRFVADRLDEHPFLLDELARDPIVRGVMARPAGGELRLAA